MASLLDTVNAYFKWSKFTDVDTIDAISAEITDPPSGFGRSNKFYYVHVTSQQDASYTTKFKYSETIPPQYNNIVAYNPQYDMWGLYIIN